MRSFEFAMKKDEDGNLVKSFPNAEIPEYQTFKSAGADFFCAEEVVIPSLWLNLISRVFVNRGTHKTEVVAEEGVTNKLFQPTLVHTGIKASMEDDEVLELYNRSSNPKKLGLVLANSVGVVDADYYGNPDNDGEIMFAFYNFMPFNVKIKVGDRIGQGVFKKFLRPVEGLRVKEVEREGGFGSSDNK